MLGVAVPSALCAVVMLVLLQLVSARIETLTIDRDDRRFFHIESFGFEPNGETIFELSEFDLFVRHVEDWSKKTNPDQFHIGFVLQRSDSDVAQNALESSVCFHESPLVKGPGNQVFRIPPRQSWSEAKTYKYKVSQPGYYHLYFSNCEASTQVAFKLKLTQFNVDSSGNRNYLSAGESSLPTWYFLLCGVFIAELVVWVQYLLRHRAEVKNIHYLMAIVLVFKILTICFESAEYHKIKVTGEPHGWNIAYYIFQFFKSTLMFGVIVLIGTGWSYLKPFLTERDKQIVLAVLVTQLFVNVAMVYVDETNQGAKSWLAWRDILHLMDMLCCCAILVPIVWSIRHLREAAEADGKAARNIERLKRFRKFYLLVVCYIYFTRIVVFLIEATLPFELTWVGKVFEELGAVVFYFVTGTLFRPRPNNPYLSLDDMDEYDGPDVPEDL